MSVAPACGSGGVLYRRSYTYPVVDETRAEPISAPDVALPADPENDVVVFPREVDQDGRGLYDDSVVTIVKEFLAEGVSASYQHRQDERSWIGEKAAPKEVLDLLIGIASNAGWSALCRVLRREHTADRVRVRVARFKKTPNDTSWEWYKVEGPGAEVAEALAAIEALEEQGVVGEQKEAKRIEP